jgi:transcriptional regulator with GAF, ATPase, and Fis domain
MASALLHELRVVFSVGAFEPSAVRLEQSPLAIGRDPPDGVAITLEDRRVSRVHAVVEREAGGWVAHDQGSRNGTWVNGLRAERAPLEHGSLIRLGSTLVLFVERPAVPGGASGRSELIGPSTAMGRVRAEARLAAAQSLPTLVTGETGVGKERVAREIHRLSGRRGPFVALNCAAISAALAESELFGHAAGAFTGATGRREGMFDAARGGTLLLDEIGDMPLDLQPKLLRALALGEVRPVGESTAHTIDVRVVAASNRDLEADVTAGRFRADLLARLGGWRIHVPPLRARREDILPLAKSMLARCSVALSADAAEALILHDWPANVRELELALAQAAVRAEAENARVIVLLHLPSAIADRLASRSTPAGEGGTPSAGEVADEASPPSARELEEALERHDYNISAVAREFGKERRQIYRWMERHGLDRGRKPK